MRNADGKAGRRFEVEQSNMHPGTTSYKGKRNVTETWAQQRAGSRDTA